MKIKQKHLNEINTYQYFTPHKREYTNEDIQNYFLMTSQGLKIDKEDQTDGLAYLLECKRNADIHARMYEQGILEGSMPYCVILENIPTYVRNWLAKNMFKGMDCELIMSV